MDPISITATCISLASTITRTSLVVIGFVKDVRAARSDLDAVSRELGSLKTVLELLADDVNSSPSKESIPQTLQKQIAGIVTNCTGVVVDIEQTLKKHEGGKLNKAAKWVASGKSDVAKLQLSLEAHKSALEIALDMVTLTLAREIKADTQEILNDTSAIKDDTAQILAEIARLQEQLPRDGNQRSAGFMLERYLDNLTSYAETVCDPFLDESDGSRPTSRPGSSGEEGSINENDSAPKAISPKLSELGLEGHHQDKQHPLLKALEERVKAMNNRVEKEEKERRSKAEEEETTAARLEAHDERVEARRVGKEEEERTNKAAQEEVKRQEARLAEQQAEIEAAQARGRELQRQLEAIEREDSSDEELFAGLTSENDEGGKLHPASQTESPVITSVDAGAVDAESSAEPLQASSWPDQDPDEALRKDAEVLWEDAETLQKDAHALQDIANTQSEKVEALQEISAMLLSKFYAVQERAEAQLKKTEDQQAKTRITSWAAEMQGEINTKLSKNSKDQEELSKERQELSQKREEVSQKRQEVSRKLGEISEARQKLHNQGQDAEHHQEPHEDTQNNAKPRQESTLRRMIDAPFAGHPVEIEKEKAWNSLLRDLEAEDAEEADSLAHENKEGFKDRLKRVFNTQERRASEKKEGGSSNIAAKKIGRKGPRITEWREDEPELLPEHCRAWTLSSESVRNEMVRVLRKLDVRFTELSDNRQGPEFEVHYHFDCRYGASNSYLHFSLYIVCIPTIMSLFPMKNIIRSQFHKGDVLLYERTIDQISKRLNLSWMLETTFRRVKT